MDEVNQKSASSPARFFLAAAVFAAFFVAQGYRFATIKGLTWDEPIYMATGYQALAQGRYDYTPEHPALIKEILALPNLFAEVGDTGALDQKNLNQYIYTATWLWQLVENFDGFVLRARMAALTLGTLLVLLLGWWAYRLWGLPAGVLALALATLEPNLVGHSPLVAFDVAVTLGIVASAYTLWELLQKPDSPRMIALGLAMGFAIGTKFTVPFLLLGILAPVALIHWWLHVRDREPGEYAKRWRDPQTWVLLFFLAALPTLVSYRFMHLDEIVRGLEFQLNREPIWDEALLFGEVHVGGSWDYFLYCMLLKVPLGIWGLFIFSLATFARTPRWKPVELSLIAVPVASVVLALTLTRVNLGFRYVMPSLTFMILAASRLASVVWQERNRVLGTLGAALVLWCVAANLRIAPHYLAYFNEIAGGPKEGIRYLGESNIDWGQDFKEGAAYVRALPGKPPLFAADHFSNGAVRNNYLGALAWVDGASLKLPRELPAPPLDQRDIVWISAAMLWGSRDGIGPVFQNRTPERRLGYSVYLYDITDSPEIYVAMASHYLTTTLREKLFHADRAARAVLRRCVARFPEHALCRGMLKAHLGRMAAAESRGASE